MGLVVYRSSHVGVLAGALAEALEHAWPDDPFEALPVVVGSLGVASWLRHELATRLDVAAGLQFPLLRPALDGATRWLVLAPRDRAPRAPFWATNDDRADSWSADSLALRLVPILRAHSTDPSFANATRFLSAGRDGASEDDDAVGRRALTFAREVADVLGRLMYERPSRSLDWARDPATADDEHHWIATLLAALGGATDPSSPLLLFDTLLGRQTPPTDRWMAVFGLSALGPGDRARLESLAEGMDIHLFLLTPHAPSVDSATETQIPRLVACVARHVHTPT